MKYKLLLSLALIITIEFMCAAAHASDNNNIVKAIAACYDENGRLCEARAVDLSLSESEYNIIILPLKRNEKNMKMYVWNDLNSMRPLTNSVETQKKQ